MKKIAITVFLVLACTLAFAIPAFAGNGNNGAVVGEAEDPNYPQLGVIRYVGNHAGYHFWFTVSEDLGPYEAGKSYHNVYKFEVKNPNKWMGPTTVPNRAPYNIVATPGQTAYYKIIETKPQ